MKFNPPTLALLLSTITSVCNAQTEPPKTLEVVELSGKRSVSTATRLDEDPLKLPFSATVVDRPQMDASGAKTLEEALRSVPGLQHGTQGNYFTRFETRGLRDTQDVLVLIDGVPFRLLQGNADITLIAPDLLERVEFIKGPASALYGKNAIGGVVQFFLKPETARGTASATLGSFGRTDASVRKRWDHADGNLFLGTAYSKTEGFQRGTDREQPAAIVSFDHKLASVWTTGAQLYATRVKALRGSIVPLQNGAPMFGITSRDNYGIPGVFIEGEYVGLALNNRVQLLPSLTLDHLSSYARYNRLFQGGITIVPPPAAVNKGYSETDTADRGLFHDVVLTHRMQHDRFGNTLQVGINWDSGWQDQASPSFTAAPTYRGPNYNTPVSNVNNDPRGIRGTVTTSRFDQRVTSFYAQNRFEWGDVGLTGGLRNDRFEQTLARSDSVVIASQSASRSSPRLGLDWRALSGSVGEHALFANWTEGFRPQAVALNTRNGVVVPALLKPEVTRGTELGVKGRAADDRWSYQVSAFQSDKIDGQRAFRNGPDTFIFSNATSRAKGVESQVQWRPSATLSTYAHYTYQDARLTDFQTFDNNGRATTNFAGYRLRMSARHIAGIGATWTQGSWSVTSSANYVGSRFLRDNIVNPQKLPAYTLLNAALSYQVNAALALQIGIDNVANTYYINDDFSAQEAGNAGAPRTAFARLRYRF